jgi:DNA polymerase-3 subunit epsilon
VSWHLGTFAAFDVESSGLSVEADRIVTASVQIIGAQTAVDPEDEPRRWLSVTPYEWLSDADGVEIPEAASKVHGITTAVARAKGRPAARVVKEIGIVLAEQVAAGVPLVIMNAPFDLTMLDRELQQHGCEPLAVQAGREPLVVDPLVLDKAADKYRPGRRNLGVLCEHYGVELTAAHTAGADARAAAQVAVAIAERYPALQVDASQLHTWQQGWARQQAASLREYLAARGRDASTVHGHWPLIPRQGGTS